MEQVRFLANMNVSPLTVASLRDKGLDAVRVSDVLPATAEDRVVLQYARETGRAIITHDLDFSALLAVEGHTRPSLVTLRISVTDPASVTRRIMEILPRIEQLLLQGCAITVDDAAVRVRRLPID